MEVSLTIDEEARRTVMSARPEHYDGYPVFDSVLVSGSPFNVHPDRAAVALALIFSQTVAGSLKLPYGCSPHVASALRTFFEPVDVHILSIDFEPSRMPAGDPDTTLHLLAEGVNDHVTGDWGRSGIVCRVRAEGAGFFAAAHELSVVTNAALIPTPYDPPLVRILPALGVALLFAEDVFAGTVALPGLDAAAESDPEEWVRLSRVLDAASLRLVTE